MREKHYLFCYACFDCRKAFKQPLKNLTAFETGRIKIWREVGVHLCPQCGSTMQSMGRKFKPPRQTDDAGWQAAYEKFVQAKDWTSKGTLLLYRIEENAGLRRRRK
jgi:hypothetical protein